MDDGVLTEIIEIPVDHGSTVDTAEQTALGIIKVAQQRGIYLRWIDATKRSPEKRAQRIAEMIQLLEAGHKQRPQQ